MTDAPISYAVHFKRNNVQYRTIHVRPEGWAGLGEIITSREQALEYADEIEKMLGVTEVRVVFALHT